MKKTQYGFENNMGILRSLRGHVWKSFRGICKVFLRNPIFALTLFCYRFFFMVKRKFPAFLAKLETPEGLDLKDAAELLFYWSMFVEEELRSKKWFKEYKKTVRPTVLDVGANVGMFSHWINKYNPGAVCIAFEPHPLIARRAAELSERRRLDLNNTPDCRPNRVRVVEAAVSHQSGSAWFHLGVRFFGLKDSPLDDITNYGGSADEMLEVRTTTLDNETENGRVVANIFLIKIDVEGAEAFVLQGAAKTLDRTKYLIIECLDKEALAKVGHVLPRNWRLIEQLSSFDYLFKNGEVTDGGAT